MAKVVDTIIDERTGEIITEKSDPAAVAEALRQCTLKYKALEAQIKAMKAWMQDEFDRAYEAGDKEWYGWTLHLSTPRFSEGRFLEQVAGNDKLIEKYQKRKERLEKITQDPKYMGEGSVYIKAPVVQ